jgi:hypothetical protein
VSSSAAQSSVLPLRGVAQIKYDSSGSASPNLVPMDLPLDYQVNVY